MLKVPCGMFRSYVPVLFVDAKKFTAEIPPPWR